MTFRGELNKHQQTNNLYICDNHSQKKMIPAAHKWSSPHEHKHNANN